MGNSELNWSKILSWNHTTKYFTKQELIELRWVDQLVSYKVSAILFEKLNFIRTPLIDDSYIESLSQLDEIGEPECKDKLERDIAELKWKLLPISNYIESITLGFGIGFNHQYLLWLSQYIQQLKELELNNIIFPYLSFSKILKELSNLNTLKLKDCSIYLKNSDSSNIHYIRFPTSLNHLNINGFYFIRSSLNYTPIRLAYRYGAGNIDDYSIDIFNASFPNLTGLEYYFGKNDTNYAKLESILVKNPQLKLLGVQLRALNQTVINKLSTLKSLEKLNLDCLLTTDQSASNIILKPLNSVVELNIENLSSISMSLTRQLCISCPKLNKLSLNYRPELEIEYSSIISRLPTLTQLGLIGDTNSKSLTTLNLQLNKVKILKLKFFYTFINLQKFEYFSGLEYVGIEHSGEFTNGQLESYYGRFRNWNCKISRSFIYCKLLANK